MGIESDWKICCQNVLAAHNIAAIADTTGQWMVLKGVSYNFELNLLDLKSYAEADVLSVQEHQLTAGKISMILWEDVWNARQFQVLARIASLLGLNERIHGRNCKVKTLNKGDASHFLTAHHLQGAVKFKTAVGLEHKGLLVAVATFNQRPMPNKGLDYTSAELVRFCTLPGKTVTGGLSKLLKYFIELKHPSDIMSYADKDWSAGNSYNALNFQYLKDTPPLRFLVNVETMERFRPHRLPEATPSPAIKYVEVFNTGNKKYVGFFRK